MSAPHHLTWCELYCIVAEALQKITISSHEEPVTLPTVEAVKVSIRPEAETVL